MHNYNDEFEMNSEIEKNQEEMDEIPYEYDKDSSFYMDWYGASSQEELEDAIDADDHDFY